MNANNSNKLQTVRARVFSKLGYWMNYSSSRNSCGYYDIRIFLTAANKVYWVDRVVLDCADIHEMVLVTLEQLLLGEEMTAYSITDLRQVTLRKKSVIFS